jgi:hypothetical protein
VGHLARLLEAAGIPTVIVAIRAFQDRLAAMTPPRVLITPRLMGQPLGTPGDHDAQRATILAALDLLQTAKQAGTIELYGHSMLCPNVVLGE